jgi:hypothetical protein
MFDFSPTGIALAVIRSFVASLSPVAVAAVVGTLVLMLIRHEVRSAGTRAALLGLAAGLGLFGLLWQGAAADGALKMQARDHALALQAERERAAAADAITRDLAERATQDLADAQADNLKLKDLLDALSRDPRGAHPAVPRDLARGLRNL